MLMALQKPSLGFTYTYYFLLILPLVKYVLVFLLLFS